MAVLTMDFGSVELKMSTLVTMIIPDCAQIGDIALSHRKVLYLLHGLSADATAWLRLTRVETYAKEHGLVVVMPSAGRSMYCDNVNGQNYFSHIATELPRYLNLVFGLSTSREDNFIAGLSMGGMGAMKVALTYPENYRAVGSFSGLLDLKPYLPMVTGEHKNDFPFLFDAASDLDRSPLNPVNLLDAGRHRELDMYVACGLQDDLLFTNYSFKKRVDELGLHALFTFEDGSHEWDFWDRHVKLFIDDMVR